MITFDTGVTVKELRARLKRIRGGSRTILLSVEVWPEAPAKRRGKKTTARKKKVASQARTV